jgi:predicted acyl esterase
MIYDQAAESRDVQRAQVADMLKDLLRSPYYSEYWKQFAIDEHWSEIDLPIFHYASWHDRYPHSQVNTIYHDAQHRSRLVLPIVPPGGAGTRSNP